MQERMKYINGAWHLQDSQASLQQLRAAPLTWEPLPLQEAALQLSTCCAAAAATGLLHHRAPHHDHRGQALPGPPLEVRDLRTLRHALLTLHAPDSGAPSAGVNVAATSL